MKERTEKQKQASRLNGSKSRGPVTVLGKDRIRTNALKHGLTANATVLANEDPHHFQLLLISLLEEFRPASDAEFLCVEEMAMAKWRMRRIVSLETAAQNEGLTGEHPAKSTVQSFIGAQQAGQLMTNLRQHESTYSRLYQRAFRHLTQLQERRMAKSAA